MDLNLILSIVLPVVAVIVVVILLFSMIKTANANEALVVSGVGATKNGNPIIKRAGGRIVLPFIQKAKYFVSMPSAGYSHFYGENGYRTGLRGYVCQCPRRAILISTRSLASSKP